MEQTQYWMWTKQQQYGMGSHKFQSSSASPFSGGDSWEEQAFAEDAAAGALGGCIWPPRCYSCTFCKKEFRSAQALGGHMNVHRRDRARLKQSQAPQTEAFPHQSSNNNIDQGTILEAQSQHQTCNFLFYPNLDFDNRLVATSSPIRVSSSPRLDHSSNNQTQYLFPYVDEQSTIFPPKSSLGYSDDQSHFLRNSVAELQSTTPYRAKGDNMVKADLSISENPRAELESIMTSMPNKRDALKADLSISLNLVICRSNNPSRASDEDEEDGRCKRPRIAPAPLNLFYNGQDLDDVSSTNYHQPRTDDLDLELRLGDPPKVK